MATTAAPFDGNRLRRFARSGALALVLGAAGIVAVPLAAFAHVEIKPGEVPGGDFSQVAFTVPNERDDASTTQLRVLLPTDQPLASVQTTPIPGWTITTKERTLSQPIDFFGSKVDHVVSEVTWTATDGGIAPGQFQDFPISLGVLPTSGQIVFKAVQTYSSGEVVTWNETAVGDTEPEHPAPVLTLTAPDEDGHGDSADPDALAASLEESSHDDSSDGSSSTLALVLSLVAVAASIAALGVSVVRRRS